MIIKKEEHRSILLQLVEQAHFPGVMAHEVAGLHDAIRAAKVEESAPAQAAD